MLQGRLLRWRRLRRLRRLFTRLLSLWRHAFLARAVQQPALEPVGVLHAPQRKLNAHVGVRRSRPQPHAGEAGCAAATRQAHLSERRPSLQPQEELRQQGPAGLRLNARRRWVLPL